MVGLANCIADRASATVAAAGELWLKACEQRGLERASLVCNARHLRLHINPLIGTLRLNALTVPRVCAYEDECRRRPLAGHGAHRHGLAQLDLGRGIAARAGGAERGAHARTPQPAR